MQLYGFEYFIYNYMVSGHAGHGWKSKDQFISYVLLWIPSDEQAKIGRPARTYIQQLCADTGCSLEDLQGAIDDRYRRREWVRENQDSCTT